MLGLLATALVVVAYDVFAIRRKRETISSAFWRLQRRRGAREACRAFWIALTVHLFRPRPRVP